MLKDKKEDEILKKYRSKFKNSEQVEQTISNFDEKDFSDEYKLFKRELLGRGANFYEGLCRIFGRIIRVNPKKKDEERLRKDIEMAHLNIDVTESYGFAVFVVAIFILFFLLLAVFDILVFSTQGGAGVPYFAFLSLIFILVSLLLLKPLMNLPSYLAARWRLKASNQMVLCILYIVMYMRHTSNLEHAIRFAANHISEPLSLDLKKVFWNVETRKFDTIRESLDSYLMEWREYNLEFVNSFHLIEASLYESSEDRRLSMLDKALDTILEGTYDKMIRYAHELKNPITMLHMLGVVLPILGLVMLPLVSSFIKGISVWLKILLLFFGYNIFLPLVVFVVGLSILSKRPTGYGESEFNFKVVKNYFIPFLIILFFFGIGLIPLFLGYLAPGVDIDIGIGNFLGFIGSNGPYGIGAMMLSFTIPFGLAFGLSIYYRGKVGGVIKKREEVKKLEKEFSGSLFQLGNRIEDGVPTEAAFDYVAKNMEGTPTGDFFSRVSNNIRKVGMSIYDAVFNKKTGAILEYPSAFIASSMEVLVESSKKGSKIVAQAMISISEYANRVRKIDERLRDLMADIISDMKSQIKFMAPVIAGIVVGISSMIISIFVNLGNLGEGLTSGSGGFSFDMAGVLDFFDITEAIPGYYFQIVIGIYVVQIVYILTVLSSSIESGGDNLTKDNRLGKNLFKSGVLYVLVGLLTTLLFNSLVILILSGLSGI